jgi:ureidoglycolate hydrolase
MEVYGKIKTITKESIAKYGIMLEHINQEDGYEPLVKVTSKGWIWAILTFKNKNTDYIECHPTSKESFEPVFGTSLIILSVPEDPTKHEIFLLDKTIMLNEGVWHNVLTISDVSRVKITENNDVTSEYFRYAKPISPVMVLDHD